MKFSAVAVAVAMLPAGASMAQSIEWKVQDGGNGHWYLRVNEAGLAWATARDRAVARGGYLATLTTYGENKSVAALFPGIPAGPGFWFGGVKVGSQWTWVTGEPWSFTSWGSSGVGCNDQPSGRDATDIYCIDINGEPRWSDDFFYWPNAVGFVVEFDADCDENGLVDFGEIVRGEKEDANGNNIPDCCEGGAVCPCFGDVDENGLVDAIDLAIVLARWGTAPKDYPRADLNDDGSVDAEDLAGVLGAWGPCAG